MKSTLRGIEDDHQRCGTMATERETGIYAVKIDCERKVSHLQNLYHQELQMDISTIVTL